MGKRNREARFRQTREAERNTIRAGNRCRKHKTELKTRFLMAYEIRRVIIYELRSECYRTANADCLYRFSVVV